MKEFVKIVVYVPVAHAKKVKEALIQADCGHIGNYDCCSFSVKGIGCFRPLKGAKPFVGKAGEIEEVEEEKIETVCEKSRFKDVVIAIKKVHPYEEPVIDIYPLCTWRCPSSRR